MSEQRDLFDIDEGRRRRDHGTSVVMDHTPEQWRACYRVAAAEWFDALPIGETFTGEQLRLACKRAGLGNPHHPNAWGSMARAFLKQCFDDERVAIAGVSSALDPVSHASLLARYRKVN